MPRLRSALALAAVPLVLLVGSASGHWRTSGSGDGAAAAAAGRSVADRAAVTAGPGTTTALLHPGGTGDLAVTVQNGNAYPISIATLTPTATGAAGCTTPALTVLAPSSYAVGGTTVTLPRTVAAGASTTFTLVGAVTMGASSNDCQSTALTLPVTVGWAG